MAKNLTPELEALLAKAKEGVHELSPEDLGGVAGGYSDGQSVSLLDPAYADIADNAVNLARAFKLVFGYSREEAIRQVWEAYIGFGIDLCDLDQVLTQELWDTL